jgi:hypothetical protein
MWQALVRERIAKFFEQASWNTCSLMEARARACQLGQRPVGFT